MLKQYIIPVFLSQICFQVLVVSSFHITCFFLQFSPLFPVVSQCSVNDPAFHQWFSIFFPIFFPLRFFPQGFFPPKFLFRVHFPVFSIYSSFFSPSVFQSHVYFLVIFYHLGISGVFLVWCICFVWLCLHNNCSGFNKILWFIGNSIKLTFTVEMHCDTWLMIKPSLYLRLCVKD